MKLMKSSESDESRQPDEKFGKWWKSTTWWKVWKVMKVDNLMKSLESDETRQPDEKLGKWWNLGKRWKKCNLLHGLSFRHFFVQANFAQKLFFDFKVTYFDKQKQQKICLEKREWNWFEEATRLRGNFEPNNCTRLPISTAILHSTILLLNAFESTTSLNRASNANASRGGGIIMKRTYFYFHRRAKALKEDFIIQIDCI